MLPPAFLQRKPANHLEVQGRCPWPFCSLLRAKKEGGPQARPEKDGYSGLSAHTMRRQPDQEVDGAPQSTVYDLRAIVEPHNDGDSPPRTVPGSEHRQNGIARTTAYHKGRRPRRLIVYPIYAILFLSGSKREPAQLYFTKGKPRMRHALKKRGCHRHLPPSYPLTALAPEATRAAIRYLENQGYRIKPGRLCGKQDFYRPGPARRGTAGNHGP